MNTIPTYIVTGATGGIGGAIVKDLSATKAPCRIILAVRDTRRGETIARQYRAHTVEMEVIHLDLSSLASVVEFANVIARRGITVTTLFNNAGTMPGGVTITGDGFEIATQTNFLATALLTERLLPAIADGGSIVFTTSITRHICRLRRNWRDLSVNRHQRFITYGRSKLMLTHYALDLSARLKDRKIIVNCSDPGIADTGIIRLGHSFIDRLTDTLAHLLLHTPAQGATAAIRAAFAQHGARIFTTDGDCRIPQRWLHSDSHRALIDDLFSTLRNF